MSAITKIFGALINVVTAIFGGIFGIFKKKKKGEFFLEIDPSKESAAASEPAQAAAIAAPAQAEVTAAPSKTDSKQGKKAKKAKKGKKAKAAKAPQAAPAAASQPAAAALAAQALNMPKPKVATIEPLNIPKFGPARRPGANMQSFLDMAKTVKS